MKDSRVRVLALDISTNAGWALLEGARPFCDSNDIRVLDYGNIVEPKSIHEHGRYPYNYHKVSDLMAERFYDKWVKLGRPEVIVIEEINLGKNRLSQRALDWIHKATVTKFADEPVQIYYINSSEWRKTLGVRLSKEQKKSNAKLSKAKRLAAERGERLDKKALGISGKFTIKHASVQWVAENLGLNFKLKDNDICDAICVAAAYLRGAEVCDGLDGLKRRKNED